MRTIIFVLTWVALTALAAHAETYLPLISGADVAAAEISYGVNVDIKRGQWLEVHCEDGEPVGTFEDGLLRVRCER